MAVTGARRISGEGEKQRFSGQEYQKDKHQRPAVAIGPGMRDLTKKARSWT
jgi:hypothetical protein